MVLSQPAADAGRAQAWASASLGAIDRRFERHDGSTIVLLAGATPTRLGEVVRFFSKAPPWSSEAGVMRVCMGAADLANVPAGSRMLLRIRAEDVAYLNVIRPFFHERRLRSVFWVDEQSLGPLLSGAPDLVDWVFKTVEVPSLRWPRFAEQGVRAAIEAGVAFAWDGEREELEALLDVVGWSGGTVLLRAEMSFGELRRTLDAPGLPLVTGISRSVDPWRIRMALARSNRSGSWVALKPPSVPQGLWRLHARQASWEGATRRLRAAGWEHAGAMAAWVDLEPERIEEAGIRVGVAPVQPSAWTADRIVVGNGPVHVLRARSGDEDVEQARTSLQGGPEPEDADAVVVWAGGAAPWTDEPMGRVEARLARALRCLGDELPAHAMVDAAADAGLTDVSAELGRIRFERGADERADRVVEWLVQYGEVEQALAIAEQWAARALSRHDSRSQCAAGLWRGDLHRVLGNGEQARRCYEESLAVTRVLLERNPGRADLQRDQSVSYERLGDLHAAQGNVEEARRYHEEGLAIARALVERAPDRADLQRDLVVSLLELGDLQVGQGSVEEARRCYEEGLAIVRALVEREPGRADLQRDLSASYERLGDLHVAQGSVEEAWRYYEEDLAITRSLAERASARFDLQRDLSLCYERLGDLHAGRGNVEEARRYYEEGLAIVQKLSERGSGRSDLQRDLSVSYSRLGDLHAALGNGEQARRYYEEGLAVAQVLSEREPGRSDLQHGLAASHGRLGDLHVALGNAQEARRYYEEGLAIVQMLSERGPGRSDLHGELALAYERMSKADPGQAGRWLRMAIDAHRARLALEPTNAVAQRDLGVALARFGRISVLQGQREQATASFVEALEILQDLRDRGILDAGDLPFLER